MQSRYSCLALYSKKVPRVHLDWWSVVPFFLFQGFVCYVRVIGEHFSPLYKSLFYFSRVIPHLIAHPGRFLSYPYPSICIRIYATYFYNLFQIVLNYAILNVLLPQSGNGKGVYILSAYSFLLSVLAGVASGIIVELIITILRKWFDRKKK